MSNQLLPPKLLLPTPDTCRWRYAGANDQSTHCGLVGKLIGAANTPVSLTIVSNDACSACCQSFPPSELRLNPIVASLLFRATEQIVTEGGWPQCSTETAARLMSQAEQALSLIHDAGDRLIPARSGTRCSFLGELLSECLSETSVTESAAVSDGETRWRCHHPAHESTTRDGCRRCRDWILQAPVSRLLSLEELIPLPPFRSGPEVRNWAVGITTSPRRESTLEACLDSVQRAGWDKPALFMDGTVRLPARFNNLPVTWREEPVGAMAAWLLALTELVLQQPNADAYFFLQDDVVLHDRESLREYLEHALWPGERPGIVSLFYTGLSVRHGWIRKPDDWHWGAQAFVFPPDVAKAIICDSDIAQISLSAATHGHIPIPETLRDWVQRSDTDVWYTTPSLSQHIGNSSTLWNEAALVKGRRAHWFSGSIETPFSADESLADFPENRFPCQTGVEAYSQQVSQGYEHMKTIRIVLAGLCRDVRAFLPRTAARVERLGELFDDYRVVLFENDSIDATVEFLSDWQVANPRVSLMSERLNVASFPQTRSAARASWLAQCRNRCRQTVLEQFADFDYIIVFDADLPGGWSYDGIAHTFGGEEFDFVGSYGVSLRQDRNPAMAPFNHQDVWAFRPAKETAARSLVNHSLLQLQRGEPWLPVESCFGGLGVYTMDCMKAAEYGGPDCEHVVFHHRLRDAGRTKLYLNPSQIVLYSP